MLKITLIILAFIISGFVVAIYSSKVVAGRCDANGKSRDNAVENADSLRRKKICSGCKTGKYTYELDPQSDTCPYIGCFSKGKCQFYEPIEKSSKSEQSRKTKKTPVH